MLNLALTYEGCREGQWLNWNYRFQDGRGRVLYCGSTQNPESRHSMHRGWCCQAIHEYMLDHPRTRFTMIVHDGDNDPDQKACVARENAYMDKWDTYSPDGSKPLAFNRIRAGLPRGPGANQFFFDGIEFPSHAAAADHYKVSAHTVRRWLGWGLTEPPPGVLRPTPCTFGGIGFLSLTAAARHFEVDFSTMKKWIERGLTEPPESWCVPITFGGIDFPSTRDAERHFGVDGRTLKSWIAQGLTEPPESSRAGKPRDVACVFGGLEFPSLSAAARHFKTTLPSIKRWIAQGLTEPPKSKHVPVTFGGIDFPTIKAAADHFGVAPPTIKKWLEKGLTEPPLAA